MEGSLLPFRRAQDILPRERTEIQEEGSIPSVPMKGLLVHFDWYTGVHSEGWDGVETGRLGKRWDETWDRPTDDIWYSNPEETIDWRTTVSFVLIGRPSGTVPHDSRPDQKGTVQGSNKGTDVEGDASAWRRRPPGATRGHRDNGGKRGRPDAQHYRGRLPSATYEVGAHHQKKGDVWRVMYEVDPVRKVYLWDKNRVRLFKKNFSPVCPFVWKETDRVTLVLLVRSIRDNLTHTKSSRLVSFHPTVLSMTRPLIIIPDSVEILEFRKTCRKL